MANQKPQVTVAFQTILTSTRNTIPLGTMFLNSAECVMGILKYFDPAVVSEQTVTEIIIQ